MSGIRIPREVTITILTDQLVERKRVRVWSGRSEVQISDWSNRTQYSKRLATAATFSPKEAVLTGDGPRKLVTRFGVIERV